MDNEFENKQNETGPHALVETIPVNGPHALVEPIITPTKLPRNYFLFMKQPFAIFNPIPHLDGLTISPCEMTDVELRSNVIFQTRTINMSLSSLYFLMWDHDMFETGQSIIFLRRGLPHSNLISICMTHLIAFDWSVVLDSLGNPVDCFFPTKFDINHSNDPCFLTSTVGDFTLEYPITFIKRKLGGGDDSGEGTSSQPLIFNHLLIEEDFDDSIQPVKENEISTIGKGKQKKPTFRFDTVDYRTRQSKSKQLVFGSMLKTAEKELGEQDAVIEQLTDQINEQLSLTDREREIMGLPIEDKFLSFSITPGSDDANGDLVTSFYYDFTKEGGKINVLPTPPYNRLSHREIIDKMLEIVGIGTTVTTMPTSMPEQVTTDNAVDFLIDDFMDIFRNVRTYYRRFVSIVKVNRKLPKTDIRPSAYKKSSDAVLCYHEATIRVCTQLYKARKNFLGRWVSTPGAFRSVEHYTVPMELLMDCMTLKTMAPLFKEGGLETSFDLIDLSIKQNSERMFDGTYSLLGLPLDVQTSIVAKMIACSHYSRIEKGFLEGPTLLYNQNN
jgi:hypothetical protein